MVSTLDDTKRMAIAAKLADMLAMQDLIIENEERFLRDCADPDICDRLRTMLEDDRKNKGVLETVIIQYGVKSEPRDSSQKMIQQARKMMESSSLSLFDKMAQHELLKHAQVGSGLIVHKCAQVVGADIEAAITPLNTVNFENRAHQEQLKGICEILGTRELTGKDPDQGLWGRVQDAVAALSGVFGSAVTQSSDMSDMSIVDVLRMDHNKARTLFMEIKNTTDAQKRQEYFGQLYKDLTAHAKAEEQVVYPAIRSYYNKAQDLYTEQAQQEQLLNEIKATSPSSPEFINKIQQLDDMTNHHINQEGNEMFPIIENNFSSEQRQQMASDFKAAKSSIQDQMAASSK